MGPIYAEMTSTPFLAKTETLMCAHDQANQPGNIELSAAVAAIDKGQVMASARVGRVALILVATMVLAACEPGQEFNPFGSGQGGSGVAATTGQSAAGSVEQDVESPEIFQVSDTGLWDGRPSLGGVWIAHPDVVDPERVLIRNEDNGNSVIGALFRRERENPGPRFQVSSDAAAELGMLAGSPNNLSVVALRRIEVPVVEETPVSIIPDAVIATETLVDPVAEATVEETSVDPIASLAASAIQAATENSPSAPLPEPTTAAAAPNSSLEKPYIQLGIYSAQSNADETSSRLRSAGIIPTVKPYTKDGKSYWRLLVGPMGNSTDRAELISKVRGLGFADAYPVTN